MDKSNNNRQASNQSSAELAGGMSSITWGILGTGSIARKMAEALAILPDAKLIAIGSRSRDKAEAFGQEYDVPLRFARYEDLVACSEVDVVYVATPHSSHARDAALALQAGRAVLCEKPLTVNAMEASALIAEARVNKVFLMEAMWTRFVPAVVQLREWIDAGAIGEIRFFAANIGWCQTYDPNSRLYSPSLAGGALLDIGVYSVSLTSMLLGTPSDISGVMHPAPTGVDAQCAVSLTYPGGALATFAATIQVETPREALIVGTEGWIRIHSQMTNPETLTRRSIGGTEETVQLPLLGNGYTHEAIEVMECLRSGRLESDGVPLDESLAVMRTLDAIRAQWGMRYAADEA